jgi:hypothetical protein
MNRESGRRHYTEDKRYIMHPVDLCPLLGPE